MSCGGWATGVSVDGTALRFVGPTRLEERTGEREQQNCHDEPSLFTGSAAMVAATIRERSDGLASALMGKLLRTLGYCVSDATRFSRETL
jgi:hypothetical protein